MKKLRRGGKAMGGLMSVVSIVQTVSRSRTPSSPPLTEVVTAVPRLITETLNGQYQGMGKGKLALLAGGVVYTVSPVNLIPSALLGLLGVVDDAVILGWIAASLNEETEKFLTWERATPGR